MILKHESHVFKLRVETKFEVCDRSDINSVNALSALDALMTLKDFTLSNVRRFYSSIGNPLAVKGLKTASNTHFKLNKLCMQLKRTLS